jgi:hypothetical protein
VAGGAQLAAETSKDGDVARAPALLLLFKAAGERKEPKKSRLEQNLCASAHRRAYQICACACV